MLRPLSITTMLPVRDLQRARDFYEQKLGFQGGEVLPDGKVEYQVSGTRIALFPREGGTKADHTAVSFQVADIDASIGALESRGVRFEDYDLPGLRTEKHVCVLGAEKAAWFKDTEGNYLCIHQDLK